MQDWMHIKGFADSPDQGFSCRFAGLMLFKQTLLYITSAAPMDLTVGVNYTPT